MEATEDIGIILGDLLHAKEEAMSNSMVFLKYRFVAISYVRK